MAIQLLSHRLGLITIAALVAGTLAAPTSAETTVTKVLLNGEAFFSSNTFASADSATIGPSGHIAIIAVINTVGERALLIVSPVSGAVNFPVRTGNPAAGAPAGATFQSFDEAWPDTAGKVIVRAHVQGPGITAANNNGYWLFTSGGLGKVIMLGDQAPGLAAGITITALGDASFSNGRVAFVATVTGAGVTTSNNRVMYAFDGTNFTAAARAGSASGIVAGVNWASFGDPVINSAGLLAFYGALNTGSATDNEVIVTGPPAGPLILVARENSAAPGAGSGITFSSGIPFPSNARINDAGDVTFAAVLSGTGVTLANNDSLWHRPGGVASATALMAREGDAIGIGVLAPHLGQFADASTGGPGLAAWTTVLTGTTVLTSSDTEVTRLNGATLQAIVREGSAAPGEGAGVLFGATNGGTTYSPTFCINASGQMLVEATVIGGGVAVGEGSSAFWGNDPVHAPAGTFKLFRQSDTVNLANIPGITTGTIQSARITAPGDTQSGRPCSINDAGTAVFQSISVNTTTGPRQGVYIASILNPTALGGACCNGATCSVLPQGSCTGSNTRFAGSGTVCNAFAIGNDAPCCFADFNQSGAVTVQDIFDFLLAYFSGASNANINGVGGITVQDIFDFLGAYFFGCT